MSFIAPLLPEDIQKRIDAYPRLIAALELAFRRLTDKAAREEIAALLYDLEGRT